MYLKHDNFVPVLYINPLKYFMLHIMQVHVYKLLRFSLGLGFGFMLSCLEVQHQNDVSSRMFPTSCLKI